MFPLKFLSLIILTASLLTGNIIAAADPFSLKSYTERDGLSDNSVTGILRDTKGFVWITTAFGINRFDGERFTLFTYPHKGMDYLLRNNFTGVTEISPGVLLFTAYSGEVYIYSYSGGKLRLLSSLNPDFNEINVVNVNVTGKNELTFSTSAGFIVTDLKFNKIFNIDLSKKGGYDPARTAVNLVLKDKSGNYWIGCYFLGLLHYDPGTGKLTEGTAGANPVDMQIHDMNFSSDSAYLWIAATGPGLLKTNVSEKYSTIINTDKGRRPFPFGRFTAISLAGDSLLLAGSRNGLLIYNLNEGRFAVYSGDQNKKETPPENVINTIYKDEGARFWIGTLGGVSVLSYNTPAARRITSGAGGTDAEVTGFYFGKDGKLFIATSRGLIIKNDSEDEGRLADFRILTGNPNTETVFQPVEDPVGNLWLGTWGGGIIRINKGVHSQDIISARTDNFTIQTGNGISNDFVKKILFDKSGNFWAATWGGGILKLSHESLSSASPVFETYRNSENTGLISDYVLDILCDKSGRIWLTTSKGVQFFDPEKERFVSLPIWNEPEGNYLNNPVFLHESINGVIWGGTYTGLIRIEADGKGGHKTGKLFFDRLPFGTYQPLSDAAGNIWFGSRSSRIYRFNPATNELNGIDLYTGGRGFSFSLGASTADKSGHLFFAGVSGAVSINPAFVITSSGKNILKISGILVNNKPALINADPSEVTEIVLNYKQNNITVNFGILDYHDDKVISYRYRLEGADNDWVMVSDPSVTFSNLSPGDYTLRLSSTGINGLWQTKETTLRIKITAAFWQTVYFRIFTGILIITIPGYLFYRKSRASKQEALRQTEFSSAIIRLQEEERRRVSGELHDSIGQNLLVLKNIFDIKSRGDIEIADDSEISDLLKDSINELRSISNDLYPHQLEQLGFIKASESMLRKISKSKGINFNFSSEVTETEIPQGHKIHLYRIIQEAASNVIKHSESENCKVSLNREGDMIILIIEDDGIGISKTHREDKLPGDELSGMGMKNIAGRAGMLGGELSISTESSKGTTIIIKFRPENES